MRLKITLIKSPIGTIPKHKNTIKSLGLNKLNAFVIKDKTPCLDGMLKHIGYLVKIDELKEV